MTNLPNRHRQFCEYSQTFKGNTLATIMWHKETMRSFLKYIPATSTEDLTRSAILDWICKGKAEKDWSPKTIHSRLQAMGLFIDWCIGEELLKHNPVKDIPKPKLTKRIPQYLTEEKCNTLLAWTRNYPYSYKFERNRAIAIISTFLATGLRKSELLNLKLGDVNLIKNEIYVRSGKGGKDRIIPFRPSLNHVLNDYLEERMQLGRTCQYFFVTLRHDKRMGAKAITRLVVMLREKSGIYFYPHLLRHTYATRMLESGLHIGEVSKLLGHADIETTAIYLSVNSDRVKEQVLRHGFDV